MTESEYYMDQARMTQADYQSELQTDLNFYLNALSLWFEAESRWVFPEEFPKEFEAWLKKKTVETAEALMEINP